MTTAAPVQNKYDRAEAFLLTCSREELELTAKMFGIALTEKRETLVSAPRTKEQLAEAIIESEEKRIAQEKNLLIFGLSQWGKDRYHAMTLAELKVEAKYKKISTARKTYRVRTVKRTTTQLINDLLYETNYTDAW